MSKIACWVESFSLKPYGAIIKKLVIFNVLSQSVIHRLFFWAIVLLNSAVKARGIGASEGREQPATVFVQFEIRPLFRLTNLSNYQSWMNQSDKKSEKTLWVNVHSTDKRSKHNFVVRFAKFTKFLSSSLNIMVHISYQTIKQPRIVLKYFWKCKGG